MSSSRTGSTRWTSRPEAHSRTLSPRRCSSGPTSSTAQATATSTRTTSGSRRTTPPWWSA
eukprot:6480657-Heterocapsa_arctica.AAC.1